MGQRDEEAGLERAAYFTDAINYLEWSLYLSGFFYVTPALLFVQPGPFTASQLTLVLCLIGGQ